MRRWLLLPLLTSVPLVVHLTAQETRDKDPYSMQAVRMCIKQRSMGVIYGPASKHIPNLGDKAGIAIAKIYTDEELRDPQNVRQFLPIIQRAFLDPRLVWDEEDRNPAVTMLLLRYIYANTDDDALKGEISSVEQYVLQQSAKRPQQ